MIEFKPIDLSQKDAYNRFLMNCEERGCEYNLSNLFLWGRQRLALKENCLQFFSHYSRRNVYLYPICRDDPKPVLDAIIADSRERGILCSLTSLTKADCQTLEALYPGQFVFHPDRDSFDYVYSIEDLSTLKGRKFQKKRNHMNKFKQTHQDYTLEPITEENLSQVQKMLDNWYIAHQERFPDSDTCLEQLAIHKGLRYRHELGLEAMVLRVGDTLLAMTMGSRIAQHTFDVQFEKADDESAYVAINYLFANYIHEKYPDVLWLNREDDLGIEGLRRAKLSYNPDHMIEKWWARLREEGYDY